MVSTNCKKYLCCFYTVLLGISGVCWIIVSSILLYRLLTYRIFIPGEAIGPFALFMLLGFVHILVTWIGWKGATREHSFHIIMFSILVGVIVIAEIATGIWCMVIRDEVDIHAIGIVDDSFKIHLKNTYNKKDWEELQQQLHCCGADGPSGYDPVGSMPTVCCNKLKATNTSSCVEVYQVGCKKPLIKHIKSKLLNLALFAFISGLCQCVGVYGFYDLEKRLKKDCEKNGRRRNQHQPSAPCAPVGGAPMGGVAVLPHSSHGHLRAPPPPIPNPKPKK